MKVIGFVGEGVISVAIGVVLPYTNLSHLYNLFVVFRLEVLIVNF